MLQILQYLAKQIETRNLFHLRENRLFSTI